MEKQSSGRERRHYVRVAPDYMVKCEKYVIPRQKGGYLEGLNAKNLSAGGVLFISDKAFELGDLLRLELDIPDWEKYTNEFYKPDRLATSKPFVTIGTVVRMETLTDGKFEVGVSFTGIDEGYRMALLRCLKNLSRK